MKLSFGSLLSGLIFIGVTISPEVNAQITPDGSLPTRVETVGDRIEITGGTDARANLFHSFKEFSVPTGRVVYFKTSPTVQNIINRVTGISVSNIDGTIEATGNVFLINPNGIIFGPNARLNITGSFLATTANSIQFADGKTFSAIDTATPVLSVNVPVGLQFGSSPQAIVVRSNDGIPHLPNFLPVGLQVPFGQTLALVGGNITLEGGNLTAYGGRITLGSVGDHSFVSLSADRQGWRLGYEGVTAFQDIQLSRGASLDTSGAGGTIALQGRNITLSGASIIYLSTQGVDNAGQVTDGSSATGDITFNASESITLIGDTIEGSSPFIAVQVAPNTTGNSGNLYMNTTRLSVQDGGTISVGTGGFGNAGNLVINAAESVEVVGFGLGISLLDSSTGSTGNSSRGNLGNGGNITINTRRLTLKDGGQIRSLTVDGSPVDDPSLFAAGGKGGSITIDATESVQVTGIGKDLAGVVNGQLVFVKTASQISTTTGSSALSLAGSSNAGSIHLNTPQLMVSNQGQISVNSFQSSGEAGNLFVNAGSVLLDRNARFIADSSSGSGGNIQLEAIESLSLRHHSLVSANAGQSGNGGNIILNTPFIFAVPQENSDISANAALGRGGNVSITAEGVFGIQFRPQPTDLSDITVSSQFAQSGTFTLNRLEVDPQSELVNLSTQVINSDTLVARTCGTGGRFTQGQFIITGRGGLPADAARTLEIRDGWADFGDRGKNAPSAPVSLPPHLSTTASEPVVEAQGWIISANGDILLTDRVPNPTPHPAALSEVNCHLGSNRS